MERLFEHFYADERTAEGSPLRSVVAQANEFARLRGRTAVSLDFTTGSYRLDDEDVDYCEAVLTYDEQAGSPDLPELPLGQVPHLPPRRPGDPTRPLTGPER